MSFRLVFIFSLFSSLCFFFFFSGKKSCLSWLFCRAVMLLEFGVACFAFVLCGRTGPEGMMDVCLWSDKKMKMMDLSWMGTAAPRPSSAPPPPPALPLPTHDLVNRRANTYFTLLPGIMFFFSCCRARPASTILVVCATIHSTRKIWSLSCPRSDGRCAHVCVLRRMRRICGGPLFWCPRLSRPTPATTKRKRCRVVVLRNVCCPADEPILSQNASYCMYCFVTPSLFLT